MDANGAGADRCGCHAIHEDAVRAAGRRLPREKLLFDLAELFKAFGDSTRVRIVGALLHSELCVCDIAALLGMSKSAISHQLRILRQGGLAKSRREGKIVFYSLGGKRVGGIFRKGLAHVAEAAR